MSIQQMFQGQPSLVPGALRGYRTWSSISMLGTLISTGLRWHHWRPQPWTHPHEAECHAGSFPCPDDVHGGSAPDADCTCGLYAWYDPEDSRIPLAGAHGPIFGAVEATGRVILGTHGMRAEKLRVVAVTSDDPDVRDVLAYFGYPVLESPAALVERYPKDDVSGLVQHECDGSCTDTSGSNVWINISVSRAAFVAAMRQAAYGAVAAEKALSNLNATLRSAGNEVARFCQEAAEVARHHELPTDPRERALVLRQRRNTGPGGTSLFREALKGRRP